jgi:hypothetical protein
LLMAFLTTKLALVDEATLVRPILLFFDSCGHALVGRGGLTDSRIEKFVGSFPIEIVRQGAMRSL